MIIVVVNKENVCLVLRVGIHTNPTCLRWVCKTCILDDQDMSDMKK